MIYFSPSQAAFYDDALFGPRQIEAVDPVAYAEAKDVALKADETEFDQAKEDAGAAELDRKAYRRHELALLANPPTHMVANLDTRIPTDAVPVSAERHAQLLEAQANGQRIVAGEDGQPVAIDVVLSPEDELAAIRRRRDRALAATDWTQIPDALTAAKRKLWQEHRKALRDLPGMIERAMKNGQKPSSVEFPVPPA